MLEALTIPVWFRLSRRQICDDEICPGGLIERMRNGRDRNRSFVLIKVWEQRCSLTQARQVAAGLLQAAHRLHHARAP